MVASPSHGDLQAAIAGLQASFEAEFRNLNVRIASVEKTQSRLVEVATQGKTGLKVLLWVGGLLGAIGAATMALWDRLVG